MKAIFQKDGSVPFSKSGIYLEKEKSWAGKCILLGIYFPKRWTCRILLTLQICNESKRINLYAVNVNYNVSTDRRMLDRPVE